MSGSFALSGLKNTLVVSFGTATAVNVILSLFGPLVIVFLPGQPIPDPDLYSRFHFQEAVNMPITATRRLLDVPRAVVDGHY